MKKFRQIYNMEQEDFILREVTEEENWPFDFGESIGMIVFEQWFPAIKHGHTTYMTTYDFPIRFKFIESPLAPEDMPEEQAREWHMWNLPEWIRCAKELEEEGVRAIVCGCGVTGAIHRALADSVSIPVFTSSVLFVPVISRALKRGQKVGILTFGTERITRWDNKLLRECGIDESMPIVIKGMVESAYAKAWHSQLTPDFNQEEVEQAIVNVAKEMVSANPEIGAIVLECTEMPLYSAAIQEATGLPVFDAVDMVKFVYNMVRPRR